MQDTYWGYIPFLQSTSASSGRSDMSDLQSTSASSGGGDRGDWQSTSASSCRGDSESIGARLASILEDEALILDHNNALIGSSRKASGEPLTPSPSPLPITRGSEVWSKIIHCLELHISASIVDKSNIGVIRMLGHESIYGTFLHNYLSPVTESVGYLGDVCKNRKKGPFKYPLGDSYTTKVLNLATEGLGEARALLRSALFLNEGLETQLRIYRVTQATGLAGIDHEINSGTLNAVVSYGTRGLLGELQRKLYAQVNLTMRRAYEKNAPLEPTKESIARGVKDIMDQIIRVTMACVSDTYILEQYVGEGLLMTAILNDFSNKFETSGVQPSKETCSTAFTELLGLASSRTEKMIRLAYHTCYAYHFAGVGFKLDNLYEQQLSSEFGWYEIPGTAGVLRKGKPFRNYFETMTSLQCGLGELLEKTICQPGYLKSGAQDRPLSSELLARNDEHLLNTIWDFIRASVSGKTTTPFTRGREKGNSSAVLARNGEALAENLIEAISNRFEAISCKSRVGDLILTDQQVAMLQGGSCQVVECWAHFPLTRQQSKDKNPFTIYLKSEKEGRVYMLRHDGARLKSGIFSYSIFSNYLPSGSRPSTPEKE